MMNNDKKVLRLVKKIGLSPEFLKSLTFEQAKIVLNNQKKLVKSIFHPEARLVSSDDTFKDYGELFSMLDNIGPSNIYRACKFGMKKDADSDGEQDAGDLSEVVDQALITNFVLGKFHDELKRNASGKYLLLKSPSILYDNRCRLTIDDLFSDERFLGNVRKTNERICNAALLKVNENLKKEQAYVDTCKDVIARYEKRKSYMKDLDSRLKTMDAKDARKILVHEYNLVKKKIISSNPEAGELLKRYERLCMYGDSSYAYMKSLLDDGLISVDKSPSVDKSSSQDTNGISRNRGSLNEQIHSLLEDNLSQELIDTRLMMKRIHSHINTSDRRKKDIKRLNSYYENTQKEYVAAKQNLSYTEALSNLEVKDKILKKLERKKLSCEKKLETAGNKREVLEMRLSDIEKEIQSKNNMDESRARKYLIDEAKKRQKQLELRLKGLEFKRRVLESASYKFDIFPGILSKYDKLIKKIGDDIDLAQSKIHRYYKRTKMLKSFDDPKLFVTRNSIFKRVMGEYYRQLDDDAKKYLIARNRSTDNLGEITLLHISEDNTISYHNVKDIFYSFDNAQFTPTNRKIIGFVNSAKLNEFLRAKSEGNQKMMIAGAKGISDGQISVMTILESKVYKDFYSEPKESTYLLSSENVDGNDLYRIEGRATSHFYENMRRPSTFAHMQNNEEFFSKRKNVDDEKSDL